MMTSIMMGQQSQNFHRIHPPAFVLPRRRCMFLRRRQQQQQQQQHHGALSLSSSSQQQQQQQQLPYQQHSSSSSSSSSLLFGGHIVARILPPDVPNDYDQHTKPLGNRIPISELIALTGSGGGSGDGENTSHHCTTTTTTTDDDDDDDRSSSNNNAIVIGGRGKHQNVDNDIGDLSLLLSSYKTKRTDTKATEEGGSLRVDAYLFPLLYDGHDKDHGANDEEDVGLKDRVVDEESIISVSLMRKESELATQALKRLELSILKKLKSNVRRPNNKKRNNNGSINIISSTIKSSKNGNTAKTTQQETTNTTIYIDGQRVDDWSNQLSDLVNGDFWTIASEHSMEICIDMMEGTSIHTLNHADDHNMGDSNNDEVQCITMPVECNPPTIVGVFTFEKFNGKIFPGIPVLVEIKSLYATHVVVDWYVDGKIVMNDSRCYIPTSKDANKRLSVVLTPQRPDHNGRGYQEAYYFSELVSEDRPKNELLSIRSEWIKKITSEGKIYDKNKEEKDFGKAGGGLPVSSTTPLRILSYNILADQNAFSMENPGMPYFPWTTVELMDRKRRMPLILHEILSYGADIICLQEVDEYIYDTILHPALKYYNYQGFFSMKMATGTREGCAMFWNLKKFQRSHAQELQTIRIGDIINDMSKSTNIAPGWYESVKPVVDLFGSCPDLQETVDNLAHVLQLARLRDLNGSPVVVANTHLFFHPLADHIRVLQCFAIAHQLSIETKNGDVPFIICGDFNTDIDDCAAILLDRTTPENYGDVQRCLNTFSWEEEQHRAENKSNASFPELQLPESFPVIISGHAEHPEFTHYVKEYKATIDHILMSSSTKAARLEPIRQAPLPTLEQVERHTAMPSISFPSDHCSVVVDAAWTRPDS